LKRIPRTAAKRMNAAAPITTPPHLHRNECGTHHEADRGCDRWLRRGQARGLRKPHDIPACRLGAERHRAVESYGDLGIFVGQQILAEVRWDLERDLQLSTFDTMFERGVDGDVRMFGEIPAAREVFEQSPAFVRLVLVKGGDRGLRIGGSLIGGVLTLAASWFTQRAIERMPLTSSGEVIRVAEQVVRLLIQDYAAPHESVRRVSPVRRKRRLGRCPKGIQRGVQGGAARSVVERRVAVHV